MKILIICSKRFYSNIIDVKDKLEKKNIEVYLPNCFDKPKTEDNYRKLGYLEHSNFKARMFKKSEETIKNMDAVLVLNFDKDNNKNYIGGATFLEMYDAFRYDKKIYMYNAIPDNLLKDEIEGFNPIIIDGNIDLIGK